MVLEKRLLVIMGKRLWDLVLLAHAMVGTLPLAVLTVFILYCLYVVKMKLGIDIFPHWGLHLPGPRTLLREIVGALRS